MFHLVLLMTRGILLDSRTRRWAMFILLLAALLMLFAGSTFLADSLTRWSFIIYWGICAWFTLAALLLALWDMLMVRAAAHRERRRIAKEILEQEAIDAHSDQEP